MSVLDRRDILDNGFVELMDMMGDDHAIVEAARVSYAGFSKGDAADKKLLFSLSRKKHTGPFEHVVVKWRVKAPLFIARQWMRHRTWSYSEISRRYTSHDVSHHVPSEWREQAVRNKQSSDGVSPDSDNISILYDDAINHSWLVYQQMIESGAAREQARMVLPQSMNTMFIGTVNLHNLLHFLRLRNEAHAQYEIRVFAQAMQEMLAERLPWTMEAFGVYG